jgi:hypothetical protein
VLSSKALPRRVENGGHYRRQLSGSSPQVLSGLLIKRTFRDVRHRGGSLPAKRRAAGGKPSWVERCGEAAEEDLDNQIKGAVTTKGASVAGAKVAMACPRHGDRKWTMDDVEARHLPIILA